MFQWDTSRTFVMGILNVTPDSFSDGGRYLAVDAAVEHGLRLHRDGADVVDVGGESLLHRLHHSIGFQSADGRRGPRAGEVVHRGERRAVAC